MATSESSTPPAGWYPDPQASGYRWWDGAGWTDNWQSALDGSEPDESAAVESRPMRTPSVATPSAAGTVIGLLSGLVMIFSNFSRWATVGSDTAYNAFDRGLPWFLTGASYDPFDRGLLAHGLPLLLVSLLGLVLVLRGSRRDDDVSASVAMIVGGGVAVLALINALAFRGAFKDLEGVGIGVGLWLSFLSGIGLAVAGRLLSMRR